MVYFRKRLTPEVLGEINEMIVRDAKERQEKAAESKDDDDDSGNHPGTGGNSGTMIVDATCAPSNIRYPQDVSLLNEARENAEALLDVLHDPADGKKPRTYRKRARKDYLKYTKCRKEPLVYLTHWVVALPKANARVRFLLIVSDPSQEAFRT